MSTIKCVVRRMSDTFDVPSSFISKLSSIAQVFADSSGNTIDLQIQDQIADASIDPREKFSSALDLHKATASLSGNIPGSSRVNTITLLLADRYSANKKVFGLMFDRGFETPDDPNKAPKYTVTAREGCVVFVGAISKVRTDPVEFQQELLFTAIHELGHLFNLPHKSTPKKNYMTTSLINRVHKASSFRFLQDQQSHLAEVDTNRFVWPGGSKFTGSSGFNLIEQSNLAKIGLNLKIGLPYREFTSLTPVELDVKLSVGLGINKRFRVANCIDPGYDEFNIWITDPDNEKRRYRSPRVYCHNSGKITISSEKPFQRDISIFLQSGGQTFYKTGVHHIQAEFNLGRRGILRSSELAIRILPVREEGSKQRIALLRDEKVRTLLYHRVLDENDSTINRIVSPLKSEKGGLSSAALHYAVGASLNEIKKNKNKVKLKHAHKSLELASKCKSGLSQCQKDMLTILLS